MTERRDRRIVAAFSDAPWHTPVHTRLRWVSPASGDRVVGAVQFGCCHGGAGLAFDERCGDHHLGLTSTGHLVTPESTWIGDGASTALESTLRRAGCDVAVLRLDRGRLHRHAAFVARRSPER